MKLRWLTVLLPALALLFTGGAASAPERDLYVVLLADPPLASYGGGIAGLAPTDPEVTGEARVDADSAASRAYLAYLSSQHDEFLSGATTLLGRSIETRFRYDAVLNGVAVELSASEAAAVASLPGVERVVREFSRRLLTDAGPTWIGADAVWEGRGTAETKGEGVVVGVIDTGVNTDHPSFADPGPVDGFDHTNPRGRFFGVCDPVLGAPFCNDKLIGVWDFTGTAPEDTNGHGSHTASTAAGNVVDARLFGPTITIEKRLTGVAPHASLITYKACITTCPITAILASINQATLDEVDVINYSIGGTSFDPWNDLDALAFLDARRAGVFVATSAGNSGPGPRTIGSPADAPWVMTVGASTHNRKFVNSLVDLTGGASSLADILGKSVTRGYGPARIVYAGSPPYNNALCGSGPAAPTGEAAINPFPPGTFNGEIVVCDRGTYGRVEKSQNVAEGGAGGFVLANDEASGDSLIADAYHVPGVHITYADGLKLKAWLASGSNHRGTITGTTFDVNAEHGDVMASFSSRGPNPAVAGILKPDVTAPGVDVFAAFNTTNPTSPPEYGIISGTSMSSPHSAGAAALVRALRPEWSPDEVRSALVSTAFTTTPGTGGEAHGVLKDDAATAADPFDMGGGRVDLRQAGRAGLVLDETPSAYDDANPGQGGDPTALNLPTLASGTCAGTCQWTRTLESSTNATVTWTASSVAPAGMSITVTPGTFTLAPGATQRITVRADVRAVPSNGWKFGQVVLVPNTKAVPEAHLTLAANKVAGESAEPIQRTTLHFHGNEHDGCTGVGNADLLLISSSCPDGPTLSTSAELDAGEPAVFASNPLLSCAAGFDRCLAEPNWLWRVSGPTVLEGPMTVEFWWTCPACLGTAPIVVFLNEDWRIRLFVDGAERVNQVVRNLSSVPAVARLVRATVNVPRTTANERVVLRIEPVFIHQREAAIYYDSQQRCLTGLSAPCDSRVQMPVVMPDLTVEDLTASSSTVSEGDTVTLTATVANAGSVPAPASKTAFREGETVLGLVDTPAIPAGATATVTFEWDTTGASAGEHELEVAADAAGAVAESNEGNNTAKVTVSVLERRADLVVADAAATNNKPREGDRVTITATIANTGDAAAAASATEFLLDGETVLGVVNTPAISAGGTATVSLGWDTRGVKGEHTIRITADSGGAVAEADDDNNAGTLTVTVRGNKVRNGSFESSSSGSSPDGWTSSGETSYDGQSTTAGPGGSWTSEAIPVAAGASYDLSFSASGSSGLVAVEQLSPTGALLSTITLPAFGGLENTIAVADGVAQVRILLSGGLTGTTFDDVALYDAG